jgi:hypothetical protein
MVQTDWPVLGCGGPVVIGPTGLEPGETAETSSVIVVREVRIVVEVKVVPPLTMLTMEVCKISEVAGVGGAVTVADIVVGEGNVIREVTVLPLSIMVVGTVRMIVAVTGMPVAAVTTVDRVMNTVDREVEGTTEVTNTMLGDVTT